ncbi:putative nucleotidyltransferase with HDIG domain [Sporomusaceae bacterium BoRhaA]|uniref:HD family phosphohydrolase n=1 Tax=Pelorhabdus rhamnosifermentans TaxID=2772457 RepID=UPI001C06339F|nr:HDIG domain-containing metalloprotein [Pelorhabdus rhamnosifermentans]MBU2701505.1 putative nucleotidyltransferase with HDIG domain [Pelorhabdus rhamnosifermentans]
MISTNSRLCDLFMQPGSIYARPVFRRIVLVLAFFSLFVILLSTDFIPDKVFFEVGQISDRDILAPRSVSYVNTVKTKQLESEVMASVVSVYDLDKAVITTTENDLKNLFQMAQAVVRDKQLTDGERLDKVQGTVANALPTSLLTMLINTDEQSLMNCQEFVAPLIHKYLQRGIREDELELTRKQIVLEINEANLSKDNKLLASALTEALLKPNFVLNLKETDKRKQSALASIDPVRDTVKKGQVLVRRGDVVTAEQIRALEELGLSKGQANELRIFGLSIFVLVIMALEMTFLHLFVRSVFDNDSDLVLLGLVVLVTLLVGKIAHYYSDFAAPMAVGALLATLLVDRRLGLSVSITLGLFFGVIVDHDLRAVVTALIGSITGVYCVSRPVEQYTLPKTGLWIAAIQFIVIGATGLVEQLDSTELFIQCVLGAFSGIAASIITIGILPYLENLFNITTASKLLDLARPNHPLLRQLLLEAPGTYHHSILVGNLAETAAAEIGADPVLSRVGAYYHDIGKIKRPYFFVENQGGGENPHEKIAPSLSTLIVTSHIKDGSDLCREYKIPERIIDVVQQHHGTTLVSYFYHLATENDHSECIIESDFRYEGPRPQSKEAALIMLADSCEAAVRSISKPNVNRIEATVRKIVKQRLHDGQLDECNLTLRDLNSIGDVYIRVLSSMFHKRIEYPDMKDFERRKIKNGNQCKQLVVRGDSIACDGGDSSDRFTKSS